MAHDEMVDGRGGMRPHWRGLLGVLAGLGQAVLAERRARLERILAEEGVGGLLPGAPPDRWRFDPIPLPLSGAEFATIEAGLIQRARLLEAVLADVYGPQRLLAEGVLPPALVFGNPGFLRPCRLDPQMPDDGLMQIYAADLVRGEDGAWRVLADRTGWTDGLAQALENRRRLGRVLPELFASGQLSPIGSFVEVWQERLQRLLPARTGERGSVALLTAGHAHPGWYGHVLLARELSCALVEGGDLTVRDGRLLLKTLRGLKPIGVLLRGGDGRGIDPLELAQDGHGVPGLLGAARGAVRIVNHPGSGFATAPVLAAFLPALAARLLGESLALPSVPTLWLGEAAAREQVRDAPDRWRLRPAFSARVAPVAADAAPAAWRPALAAAPWRFAATEAMSPSAAPCLGATGLEPGPVLVRVFLIADGHGWRAMPGGLGCVPAGGDAFWPASGPILAKDVWVLAETPEAIFGPPASEAPRLEIRRAAGDLPSRVADNFFWFGRYLERLEGGARLLRITIARTAQPAPAPHELAEITLLADCLIESGLLDAEAIAGVSQTGLAQALLRAAGRAGALHRRLTQVMQVSGQLRDRLTGEMHAVIGRGLRDVEEALGRVTTAHPGEALDSAAQAMARVLAFSATIAGLAAENMVRGGGRLFLDLGRRVERAQAVADELARVLDFPGATELPARVEHGLRLALELCDSSITYRARYLAVLQPAPVLDLVLADEGNPRGLGYQLAAARALLAEIAGSGDASLALRAADLSEEAQAMARDVAAAPDQARAALRLPARLRALRDAVAELSNGLSRRYFALLPPARRIGS